MQDGSDLISVLLLSETFYFIIIYIFRYLFIFQFFKLFHLTHLTFYIPVVFNVNINLLCHVSGKIFLFLSIGASFSYDNSGLLISSARVVPDVNGVLSYVFNNSELLPTFRYLPVPPMYFFFDQPFFFKQFLVSFFADKAYLIS